MSTSWGRRVAYVCIALVGITAVGTTAYKTAYVPSETSSRYAQGSQPSIPTLETTPDALHIPSTSAFPLASNDPSSPAEKSNTPERTQPIQATPNPSFSFDTRGTATNAVDLQSRLPAAVTNIQKTIDSQGRGSRP